MSGGEVEAVRVMLVDDHPALREPLAHVFDAEPGFETAAQAGSLAEARAALAAADRAGITVDLAVLDLDLPDGFGAELIADLRRHNPRAQALVLTGISGREQIALAIEAGAAGVASKASRLEDILGAARRIGAGEQLLSPQEILDAVRLAGRRRTDDREARDRLRRLTPREREVLSVLAEGLGDREIAGRLHVGRGTVRTHVESVLRKLGVASRLQAVVFAARHGQDPPP